jgi:hypothetical protein
MQMERDLADATRKLYDARWAVTELRSHKPARDDPKLQEWQYDLAEAIGGVAVATRAHQKAAKDLEKCKEENPRPNV